MKWWLIAWREIRWEVFLDRASLLRTGVFIVIPLFFVISNRGIASGPQGDVTLIGLALPLLYLVTTGSVTMIVAARVKTSRAAQQIAGLVIALSAVVFAAVGFVASQLGEGWPLLALGAGLVVLDVLALEIARRVWQR